MATGRRASSCSRRSRRTRRRDSTRSRSSRRLLARQHARYFAELATETAGRRPTPTATRPRSGWRPSSTTSGSPGATRVGRGGTSRGSTPLGDALWPVYEARGWYHATIQLIEDVLGVLAARPETPDRWERELTLRTSRARAITLLRGYTGEAEDAYARGAGDRQGPRRGAAAVPGPAEPSPASTGSAASSTRGSSTRTRSCALAEAQDDANMRVDGLQPARRVHGVLRRHRGGPAVPSTRRSRRSRPVATEPRKLRFGIDTRVSGLTTSGFFLWLSGFPDRAVARADRAIALATDIDHPYSLAYALLPLGVPPPLAWRGGARRGAGGCLAARGRDERSAGLARARDLPARRGDEPARPARGGPPPDGRRARPVPGPPDAAGLLADDPVHAGRGTRPRRDAGPGLALIDEALEIEGADTIDTALYHIVRGDLSLLEPGRDTGGRDGVVRERLRRCRPIRRANAAAPRRRPTVPDRHRRRTGRPGSETLRAVHATFTEGHSTPDLVEAAALLA